MLDERFWGKVSVAGPEECWEWLSCKNNKGYGLFSCRGLGFKNKQLAHRLSYFNANGGIMLRKHILHSCDNPACVNPHHLSIGTAKDNMVDAARKGRSGNMIVSTADSIQLMWDYIAGVSHAELAEKYGVSERTIPDFIGGKSRKWIYDEPGAPTREQMNAAKRKKPGAKITKSDAADIKKMIRNGVSGASIAKLFNISRASVSDIRTGKTWKDVE